MDGCDKPHYGLGYCKSHYRFFKKYGSPESPHTQPGEPMAWLRNHVSHSEQVDCLIWPFARSKNGYGIITHEGRQITASRAMAILAHGEPPSDRYHAVHVCGCGHLGCVNPNHVIWDTPVGNAHDKKRHGTYLRGSRVPGAKLNEEQVMQIVGLLNTMRRDEIAKKYKVGISSIHSIAQGRRWGWLTGIAKVA